MADLDKRCPLCGNNHNRLIAREIQDGYCYTIILCLACSFVYIKEINAALSPEYMGFCDEDINEERIWQQTRHKELAFNQCLRLIDSLWYCEERKVNNRKLLDVGCGIGGFLNFAQAHFECYGFDASPAHIRYAEKYQKLVRCATNIHEYQEQLGISLPEFQLITLWDVLEHIRDFKDFLKTLSEKLALDGYLFISVPNAAPMIIKSNLTSKGFWPRNRFSWNPREHISYFSPMSLAFLLRSIKLRIIRIGPVSIYGRPLSLFEIGRRSYFALTRLSPHFAPQIYAIAKRDIKARS